MDARPSFPPEPLRSSSVASDCSAVGNGGSLAAAAASNSNQLAEVLPLLETVINGVKSRAIKNEKKKKKKSLSKEDSDAQSSSTSSVCSTPHLIQRGIRVASKQRNPRALIGSVRQKEGDVDALALPLGMSIAAVVAQVLDTKDTTGETMAVDLLSKICTLAVRESLANVFGDKYDDFVRNFEKSFRSTLMTLRSINASSCCSREHPRVLNKENNYLDAIATTSLSGGNGFACRSDIRDCQSEAFQHDISPEEHLGSLEESEQNTQPDSINQELVLHRGEINRQLTFVSPRKLRSENNQSTFNTLEKSLIEHTRANDLKTFEIGLTIKKLQLKEKMLALNSDSNFLERCKLSMGAAKQSFKAEKFKIELEETRCAELLKKCIDCFVAGLLVMLASIAYATYVYSSTRITEATASCTPAMNSKSWWIPNPMSSFNSGLKVLWCRVQVFSRLLFGLLMIFVIAYLLVRRSAISTQTMPFTLIILLGFACGFAGMLCIDTLGGSGVCWLICWEVLCSLYLLSNIWISALYFILHGPIAVSQEVNSKVIIPYWIRRVLFFATLLLFLPLLCGLMPFASLAEWIGHFSSW